MDFVAAARCFISYLYIDVTADAPDKVEVTEAKKEAAATGEAMVESPPSLPLRRRTQQNSELQRHNSSSYRNMHY